MKTNLIKPIKSTNTYSICVTLLIIFGLLSIIFRILLETDLFYIIIPVFALLAIPIFIFCLITILTLIGYIITHHKELSFAKISLPFIFIIIPLIFHIYFRDFHPNYFVPNHLSQIDLNDSDNILFQKPILYKSPTKKFTLLKQVVDPKMSFGSAIIVYALFDSTGNKIDELSFPEEDKRCVTKWISDSLVELYLMDHDIFATQNKIITVSKSSFKGTSVHIIHKTLNVNSWIYNEVKKELQIVTSQNLKFKSSGNGKTTYSIMLENKEYSIYCKYVNDSMVLFINDIQLKNKLYIPKE